MNFFKKTSKEKMDSTTPEIINDGIDGLPFQDDDEWVNDGIDGLPFQDDDEWVNDGIDGLPFQDETEKHDSLSKPKVKKRGGKLWDFFRA